MKSRTAVLFLILATSFLVPFGPAAFAQTAEVGPVDVTYDETDGVCVTLNINTPKTQCTGPLQPEVPADATYGETNGVCVTLRLSTPKTQCTGPLPPDPAVDVTSDELNGVCVTVSGQNSVTQCTGPLPPAPPLAVPGGSGFGTTVAGSGTFPGGLIRHLEIVATDPVGGLAWVQLYDTPYLSDVIRLDCVQTYDAAPGDHVMYARGQSDEPLFPPMFYITIWDQGIAFDAVSVRNTAGSGPCGAGTQQGPGMGSGEFVTLPAEVFDALDWIQQIIQDPPEIEPYVESAYYTAEENIQRVEEDTGAGVIVPLLIPDGCLTPEGTPWVADPVINGGACSSIPGPSMAEGDGLVNHVTCYAKADRPHAGTKGHYGLVAARTHTLCPNYQPPAMENRGWLREQTPAGDFRTVDYARSTYMQYWSTYSAWEVKNFVSVSCPGMPQMYKAVSWGWVRFDDGSTNTDTAVYPKEVYC